MGPRGEFNDMEQDHQSGGLANLLADKPLQASKFAAIVLAIGLGVAGFLRFVNVQSLVGDPILGDGQFLALILLPLVSLGLVAVVFAETLVAGYRLARSDRPIAERTRDRTGYVLVRAGEAAIAVTGVLLMASAVPPLFAESTPAPAGVGIMLLLFVVGFAILVASLVRSGAELFVWR